MAKETVKVPDIGTEDAVDVIEILVAVGDTLAEEDSLVTLESAKASVEVPSPLAGKVLSLSVKVGDQVHMGDALLELDTAESNTAESTEAENDETETVEESEFNPIDDSESEPAPKPVTPQPEKTTPAISAQPAPTTTPETASATTSAVHAGPAVRKLARQMQIDLAAITHTSGNNGRITKEDVYAHVANQAGSSGNGRLPVIDFSRYGEVEAVPTSRLQRTAAQHLQQGWQTIPQVTQHEEVDITELEAFRKAENQRRPDTKLTLLAFVAKAVVAALIEFPRFNASLSPDGQQLIMKHYTHLGFAVDTERGLLVPVLKDADKLGVRQLAGGVADLAEKARNKALYPSDMEGASFTLSSLGGIGGTAFTPLVNWPQVAILGISRAQIRPVWQDDAFQPRLMLPLSLSYDHRVIDGADAARFVVYLHEQLNDIRRLLL